MLLILNCTPISSVKPPSFNKHLIIDSNPLDFNFVLIVLALDSDLYFNIPFECCLLNFLIEVILTQV